MPFNADIIQLARQNSSYRKVLYTGKHSQVVLMSLAPGQEIGMEVHTVDQILIFVHGTGQAIIDGQISDVFPHHLVFVTAGSKHNFKNTGTDDLKLFTIYAPAQ